MLKRIRFSGAGGRGLPVEVDESCEKGGGGR